MSNELTTIEKTPEALEAANRFNASMVPQTFEAAWRLANIFSRSGLMPKGIASTEAAFVAIQMGMEVGLSPMQAVQNVAVVNGRPSIYGDAVMAIVQGSGELEEFREWFEGTDDALTAFCSAKRTGYPNPVENSFSISEAKQAGLFDKNESIWKKYPKRMLKWRARNYTLRDLFSDKLKGIRTYEEALDYEEIRPGNYGPAVTTTTSVSPEAYIKPDGEPTESAREALERDFKKRIPEGTDPNLLEAFLYNTMNSNDATKFQVKKFAITEPGKFWKAFEQYKAQNTGKGKKESQKEEIQTKEVPAENQAQKSEDTKDPDNDHDPSAEKIETKFGNSIPDDVDQAELEEYLTLYAKGKDMEVIDVKMEAIGNLEKFWKVFSAWSKQQEAKRKKLEKNAGSPSGKSNSQKKTDATISPMAKEEWTTLCPEKMHMVTYSKDCPQCVLNTACNRYKEYLEA